jgi:hypothetical protein
MRLVLFVNKGASLDAHRVGVQSSDEKTVTDVTAALADAGLAVTSMRKFLELGAKGREVAEAAVSNPAYARPADAVVLRAPIYDRCAFVDDGTRAFGSAPAPCAHPPPATAPPPAPRRPQ